MDLIIFIGLQASGKSTFYRTRFAQTHVLVSKDLSRHNRTRGRRQAQLIVDALEHGRSVVVDNTNPTVEERAGLISLGRRYGARIAGYYFASSVGACLERNRGRDGASRVPDVAIFATARRLAFPSCSEGFAVLYEVRLDDDNAVAIVPLPASDASG